MKLKEDRLLQVDEEAELESLMTILQDVQLNRQVDILLCGGGENTYSQ